MPCSSMALCEHFSSLILIVQGAAKADKISLSKMMEFNARRKLKRAVMGVVAAQKMKNLLGAFGAGGGAHAADDDDDD
jgi:hypothetical protein